jgi:hypothetical protein
MSDKVMEIVAEAASEVQKTLITIDNIKSHSRKMEIVRARQFYHYVMRTFTKLTLDTIAKQTRNDHAAVIHSLKVIDKAVGFERRIFDRIYNVAFPQLSGILEMEDFQLELEKAMQQKGLDEAKKMMDEKLNREVGKERERTNKVKNTVFEYLKNQKVQGYLIAGLTKELETI